MRFTVQTMCSASEWGFKKYNTEIFIPFLAWVEPIPFFFMPRSFLGFQIRKHIALIFSQKIMFIALAQCTLHIACIENSTIFFIPSPF